MSGLSSVSDNNGTYLSIAGGFIWNRKADKSDPDYAEQTFVRVDKTEGVRAGARYADLTGMVTGVEFKTHPEYGESINVSFQAGDSRYIISISTNNRYSQDMMKCLLVMDLDKELFMKPYDFVGSDKRRAMGISFRQDGEKINLRVDNAPTKDKDWFKTADKKSIRRFFEDLTEWFVAEVESEIVPQLASKTPAAPKKQEVAEDDYQDYQDEPQDDEEKPVKKKKAKAKVETPEVSPLKMKKALKAYIAENYEGETLPKLSREELVVWYNLSLQMEELPFEEDENGGAEVSKDDLEAQLDLLIPNK
jgi:uncharacterized protein YdaT